MFLEQKQEKRFIGGLKEDDRRLDDYTQRIDLP